MKNRFLLSLIVLALTSCGTKQASNNKSAAINIDGSGTVTLITRSIVNDYKGESDVPISIGTSGTGGGFKKFEAGEIDINQSSRPINTEEDAACKAAGIDYIELPVAYDGLAIVVNKSNSWLSSITVSELKKMWEPGAQGKITTWNQVNLAWPKEDIHLFGHRTATGSLDYFTEAINGVAKATRTDYAAGTDSAIVANVSRDKYALGYLGLGYYERNESILKVVGIDNEKGGGPVVPERETVKNGTYQPLSRPLFIYVNKKSLTSPEVKAFVDYYLANAAQFSNRVGYVAMSDQVYDLAKARLASGTTGSSFLGKNWVGIKMEDILKAEQTAK